MIKQKSSEMGVSKKEKRGLVITEIFMILLAAVWFIPIYYLIVTTFKIRRRQHSLRWGFQKSGYSRIM